MPPPGWERLITLAQEVTELKFTDGTLLQRIRYGDEADDWGANERPCHDCNVVKGQLHIPGCDVERCPSCGGQLITCGCDYTSDGPFDWAWPPEVD